MSVINIKLIVAAIEQAEEVALDEVADFIVRDAKVRAPVRKVFKEAKGYRRKFRPLTSPERNLAIKRAMAYAGYSDFARRRSVSYLRNYARAEKPRRGSANAITRTRNQRILGDRVGNKFVPRVDASRVANRRTGQVGFSSESLHPLLTLRGRYDLRTGRGVHQETLASGAVRFHLGGRLKASIVNAGVDKMGQGASARVVAGVRYAKFVEFPTTHNAAQPFLLPALHDNRARLKSVLAREIKSRLGG